ncbi:MAG: uracil-DNA glycosylase [bacterium]
MNISVKSKKLINLESSWLQHLEQEFSEDYMQNLLSFLVEEKSLYKIYPPLFEIFNAFNLTPFDKVKVVIIGQDPYHAAAQAHGLCFSVRDGVKFPPSLVNIFKELERSIEGFKIPKSGNLSSWAKQGVFLLNTSLTVRENKANSHAGKGWEIFTDKIIEILNVKKNNLVFMLWGSHAKNKGRFIDGNKHLILEAVHPSPLSAYRGFIGCDHFLKANCYLDQHGLEAIDWCLI